MIKVLITGCSMHSNDLINVLRNNADEEEISIVGINCEDTALLRKGVDSGYIVPRIDDPDYVPTLMEICIKEKVDVILPFITAELPLAVKYKPVLEAVGTKVSVTSGESLSIVGDKVRMAERYPQLMPRQRVLGGDGERIEQLRMFEKQIGFPEKRICMKLHDKCGGVGFAVIDEKRGLDLTRINKFGQNRYITNLMAEQLLQNTDETVILQEYEEGIDYSLCILAENGKVLHSLGFAADIMSFGSAMAARIKKNQQAEEIAELVTSETELDGNACFDFMMKKDGTVKLLEVNPRLSASLPFIAKAGLNLPYMRVKQLLGGDVRKNPEKINLNLRMSKNYESEYFT